MSVKVKEGHRDKASAATLPRFETLLPDAAEALWADACLDKLAGQLAHFAQTPEEAEWRNMFRAPLVSQSVEDALLLEIIPRAARILGVEWVEDRLSFVDVSIAAARFQELVRRLGARASRAARTPVIPVLVPPWEQHMLAAALVSHRICRAGQRAVLLSGLPGRSFAAMPLVQMAPAILVSAVERPSSSRMGQFLRELQSCVKSAAPIIAGGPAFETRHMDSQGRVGAISVTNDPVTALRAHGLSLEEPEYTVRRSMERQ